MENVVLVNSADFKFSDFSDSMSKIPAEYHNEDWYIILREIDAKIANNDLKEKINFSDDRCVLIAYKIMAETNLFEKGELREWWIVKRYLDIYADANTANVTELREFVTAHIGQAFSGAQMSESDKEHFIGTRQLLQNVIYEDNYLKLPEFVVAVIDEDDKRPIVNSTKNAEPLKESKEFYLTEQERTEWEALKNTSLLKLEDKSILSEQEIEQWQGALDTSILMLE